MPLRGLPPRVPVPLPGVPQSPETPTLAVLELRRLSLPLPFIGAPIRTVRQPLLRPEGLHDARLHEAGAFFWFLFVVRLLLLLRLLSLELLPLGLELERLREVDVLQVVTLLLLCLVTTLGA